MKLQTSKLAVILSSLVATGAFAQAKAPEPDWSVSYNVGVVSEYRYRGISQTRFKPALQGGVDLAHKSGAYVGAWASTIHWIKDWRTLSGGTDTGNSKLEIDLYGGYKGELAKGLGYDVGVLHYWYPSNKFNNLSPFNGWATPKAETTEVYAALTYGAFTAKYSHAVSNIFGNADSKGSGYLDLSATFDLGKGWSIVPHVGHQTIKGTPAAGSPNSIYSYSDYSIALNKDMGNGWVLSATAVDTSAKRFANGTPAYAAPDATGAASASSRDLGRSGLILGAKYSF